MSAGLPRWRLIRGSLRHLKAGAARQAAVAARRLAKASGEAANERGEEMESGDKAAFADAWEMPYSVFRRESDGQFAVNLEFLDAFADADIDMAISGDDLIFWVRGVPYAKISGLPRDLRSAMSCLGMLFIFYRDGAPVGEMAAPPIRVSGDASPEEWPL